MFSFFKKKAQLPKCGRLIRYIPKHDGFGRVLYGEFIFAKEDIQNELIKKLENNPHLFDGHEGAIFNWIGNSDESINEVTDVPEIWNRFIYIADELIHQGLCISCICSVCHNKLPLDSLINDDDNELKNGWNSNKLFCNNGHLLLRAETTHIILSDYQRGKA